MRKLTQQLVIDNIKEVCAELGLSRITREVYDWHGTYSIRSIDKRWGWATICELSGLQSGEPGKPKAVRKLCAECGVHHSTKRYCHVCTARMKRQSQGALA